MSARWHTTQQLEWFEHVGVNRFDLACHMRAGDGPWMEQDSRDRDLDGLQRCLSWARAVNAKERANVYIRPARCETLGVDEDGLITGRSYRWPVVFLDDVDEPTAEKLVERFVALAVRTSTIGGCHVWIQTDRSLPELERKAVQRDLCRRLDADPASISGEHWGRLAGMRNHKRGGQWTGVVARRMNGTVLEAKEAIESDRRERKLERKRNRSREDNTERSSDEDRDTSASGREWGWVCERLEDGEDVSQIERDLYARAKARDKRQPRDYARRTVRNACRHVGVSYR